ncbi:hypothetical protein BaRGS_00029916, partial [Batillaria attramentaria]
MNLLPAWRLFAFFVTCVAFETRSTTIPAVVTIVTPRPLHASVHKVIAILEITRLIVSNSRRNEDAKGTTCDRLSNFNIEVFTEDPVAVPTATPTLCHSQTAAVPGGATVPYECDRPIIGRYVRIQKNGTELYLCEVQVMTSYG